MINNSEITAQIKFASLAHNKSVLSVRSGITASSRPFNENRKRRVEIIMPSHSIEHKHKFLPHSSTQTYKLSVQGQCTSLYPGARNITICYWEIKTSSEHARILHRIAWRSINAQRKRTAWSPRGNMAPRRRPINVYLDQMIMRLPSHTKSNTN